MLSEGGGTLALRAGAAKKKKKKKKKTKKKKKKNPTKKKKKKKEPPKKKKIEKKKKKKKKKTKKKKNKVSPPPPPPAPPLSPPQPSPPPPRTNSLDNTRRNASSRTIFQYFREVRPRLQALDSWRQVARRADETRSSVLQPALTDRSRAAPGVYVVQVDVLIRTSIVPHMGRNGRTPARTLPESERAFPRMIGRSWGRVAAAGQDVL